MSARVREPTDDAMTEIYDPDRPRARMVAPAGSGPSAASSAPAASSGRRPAPSTLPAPAGPPPPKLSPPERTPPQLATLTHIDQGPGGVTPDPPVEAVPALRKQRLERSEPIRVISMKDHAEAPKPRSEEPRVPLHVQLRSMAEVAGLHDAPVGLGNLAPPRDPRQARARRLRANVVWACVAIALACAISLAIWFIAGR